VSVADARTPGALEKRLRARRDAGAKLLVPYVTGGMGEDWLDAVHAVADAGADAIEIGIPFSDPVIDGPTIQEASVRALARGTTPASILAALSRTEIGVPLVVMTYYNIIFRAGHRRFADSLVSAGVVGAIVPDLQLDEAGRLERGGRRRRGGDGVPGGTLDARRAGPTDLRPLPGLRLRGGADGGDRGAAPAGLRRPGRWPDGCGR
jgi:hypothetical protein